MDYIKKADGKSAKESRIYHVDSIYEGDELNQRFLQLKANVCDINPAFVKKCITGMEQDFILLMEKAQDYIRQHFLDDEEKLLCMLQECVFGYYVIAPLIEDKAVSDIKVLSWDHIVIKANGERYVSDITFFD
ncbi:MAG: hypothetical protein K6E75_00545, partial [Lachnospiraceae bacterium]|nr:hypothetical protein [Lachnospiraceae bacterium]